MKMADALSATAHKKTGLDGPFFSSRAIERAMRLPFTLTGTADGSSHAVSAVARPDAEPNDKSRSWKSPDNRKRPVRFNDFLV